MPDTPIRVLVIEDNDGDARLIEEMLSESTVVSFALTQANSLSLGLPLLKSKEFDVLLLDLGLPESQGLETLQRVIAHDNSVPIVIITGLNDEMLGIRGVQAGAQDYLIKGQPNSFVLRRSICHAIMRTQVKQVLARESEERRILLDNIQTQIWYLTDDHTYGAVNEAHAAFNGVQQEDLAFKNMYDIFPKEIVETYCQGNKEVFTTGKPMHSEGWVPHVSGEQRLISILKSPRLRADGTVEYVVCSAEDITERKRAEEALKMRERSYRTLAENMPGIVYRIHIREKGRMQFFNNMLMSMTGYTEEELTQGEVCSIDPLIIAEDRARVIDEVNAAITENRRFHVEYRITHKDGNPRFFNERGQPIIDDTGILYIDGLIQDITDSKKTELALQQVNRKLNLLSTITRHDILNQLLMLKGYLELSQKFADDPKKLSEFIKNEQQAAAAIEKQITFTREYQEMGVNAPGWLNVKAVITQAQARLPLRNVSISVDRTDLEIFADPLFEKAFYNLIDNALRYGGEQMKTIRVSSQEFDRGLTLVCEDDGVGIMDEDKNHLFTRGFGKNTGLGLFLSREILGITDIMITENSTPGKGARFEITVPKGAWRNSGKRE